MNSVKTYKNIHKANAQLNFSISRMDDIYTKRQGKADEPHRHDYYTVLIVSEAYGEHIIDFNSYDLGNQQIYFVSPGQVHQVIEKKQSLGYVMTFSTDFLIRNAIPLSFISDLNLFQNYGVTPPLSPNEIVFNKVLNYSNDIFELFHSDQKNKFLSIGAFLKLILIQCGNSCELESMDSINDQKKGNLIRDFKNAVDNHYKMEHNTRFYARQLNITPDHLNRLIRDKLGKTAKEYIQARITTEAKRLLCFTDLTSKEIGYELGFSEPANFSAFFKKCTHLSPSNFRKKELKS